MLSTQDFIYLNIININIKLQMNKGYLTEEWKQFRFKIFKRDNFECIKCSSKSNLQCHHTYYVTGWKLWDYPDESMQTLCKFCHEEFHKTKKGGQMFISKKKAFSLKAKTQKKVYPILSHIDIFRTKFEIRKLEDDTNVKKKNKAKIKERLEYYRELLNYNESIMK
jgi:hypothetical protein